MTITEVAKDLEVSHWTVRRWIKQRKFSVIKINSRVIRINRDELEKFKRKHTIREWQY